LGVFQKRDTFDMFFVAVSLSVAAIPEGLPAIVTIVLALGVQRLSKKNAVIRNLPAVETLGSSSVICSDKTGTLTENKMTVVDDFNFDNEGGEFEKQMIIGILLCNDATVVDGISLGDPTETALLNYAEEKLGGIKKILSDNKRLFDIPFDSERKLMTTVNEAEKGVCVYTKGGLDEILEKCTNVAVKGEIVPMKDGFINKVKGENMKMASKALRVLGVAYKEISGDNYTNENTESNLVFLGIVGMIDPIRKEAKEAINTCKNAGIRSIMITGDHKLTAIAIAKKLGIIENENQVMTGKELENLSQEQINLKVENIGAYARVSPEHKVKIVKGWQSRDKVVAMTGDGVNDAPALKMAEIGVAMGKVGTDVARNSSDMVLMDDNFATIVTAINEGRGIYQNIKKTIRYLLSCNIGEVLLLVIAMLGNLEVPLLPIHILWVNLVTDSFPALALGVEPLEDNAMTEKPRKKGESVFSGGLSKNIVKEGFEVGIVALLIYIYGLRYGLVTARTMAFLTITFTQLFHSLAVRSEDSIVFKKGIFTNKYLIYAIFISAALQITIVSVPFIRTIFKVSALDLRKWILVIAASLIPFVFSEITKLLKTKKKKYKT
jgi:Ca2+-transporting ATPase